MQNELKDKLMKKTILKVMLFAVTLVIMNNSLYSNSFEDLGDFIGIERLGFNLTEGRWITNVYFQFGMITKGVGDDTIYLYGEEDLPGLGKRSIGLIDSNKNIESDDDISVYVYEANDLANPIPKTIMKIDNISGFNLKNLDLESGKLYIILFSDINGKVVNVKKIIITE